MTERNVICDAQATPALSCQASAWMAAARSCWISTRRRILPDEVLGICATTSKPADPLVRRDAAGYPRLKLADVDFGPCHDERLGHLAGLGVRARDYGGVQQPGHG